MLTGVPFWLRKVLVTRTKPGVVRVTVPPGALIDATLMSFRAFRFTLEVRSRTTGLTFILPMVICFPAKTSTV